MSVVDQGQLSMKIPASLHSQQQEPEVTHISNDDVFSQAKQSSPSVPEVPDESHIGLNYF